jgi:Ca-activated chloride channel family protein
VGAVSAGMHGGDARRLGLRGGAAVALLACLSLLAAPAKAQQPDEAIRVSVDRVSASVTVTDPRGNFVEGLRREDFHIFDDGTEQPITDFAAIEEPAQILLMVEAGPAVYFLEGSHLQAARALLDGLSPGDRVAVVKYDEGAEGMLDFSADKRDAEAALSMVRFNLGFGMLNLSSSVSTVLDWLAKVQGKKTLVLLSTGVDTSPPEVGKTLMDRAATTDVRILAVSLSAEIRSAPEAPANKGDKKRIAPDKSAATAEEFAKADHLLTALAEATGGRVYFPKNAKDFSSAYTEIAQLVRHEYSLAFAPPHADGKIHSIEVRVGATAASPIAGAATSGAPAETQTYRVDCRRAYVAPSNSH